MAVFRCAGKDRINENGDQICSYESDRRWRGRCPGCFNYYDVLKIGADKAAVNARKTFAALEVKEIKRITTGIIEFDKVIGGGLVAGSTVVISGPPKTGKSTLLVQIAAGVGKHGKVLYASGEQSESDIGQIVHRTNSNSDNVELMGNCGNVKTILERAVETKPTLVIIDSLHTAYLTDVDADAGSPSQIKAIANEITEYGKKSGICFVLICHVNKDGDLAGPRTLEHVVDTLTEFYKFFHEDYDEELDDDGDTLMRELSSSMNRNATGPETVRALFRMTKEGIKPVRKKSKLELV